MPLNNLNDDQLRERLKEIDEDDDVDLTSWECDFVESVVFKMASRGPLSQKQRETALKIIERYS